MIWTDSLPVFNQNILTDTKFVLHPYAKKSKAVLKLEQKNHPKHLSIKGVLPKYPVSEGVLWVSIVKIEKKNQSKTVQQFFPIQDKRFQENLSLPFGRGFYQIDLFVSGPDQKEKFYPFATIYTEHEADPSVPIQTSVVALENGFTLLQVPPIQVPKPTLTLNGKLENQGIQRIMLRIQKGANTWSKLIYPENGFWKAEVPFLFGKGAYQVQLLLPTSKHSRLYKEAISLTIHSLVQREMFPIHTFQSIERLGLEILQPAYGEKMIGPVQPLEVKMYQKENLESPLFLAVLVQKGMDQAITYLPITEGKGKGKIYLRFGEGEYLIRLLQPDLTKQPKNQLYLTPLAEWKVISTHNPDRRELLPSRGVESDHPTMQKLARRITAHAKTERQKAYFVYRYVATHITYDVEKYKKRQIDWQSSALRTWRTKKGICEDFSLLTIALLRAINIPARMVEGTVLGQPHAWVEAKLDGIWISLDPTWGAGFLTKSGKFQKQYQSIYFNPSPQLFSHHRKERVVY